MDLIEIIMPIYNVEKYLERCLNSLKEQTYSNFKVLMIDDGSKDNSSKIALDFSKNDSRFIYYKKENGGLSDARNYGIKLCESKYITFIDSDDFVHKDFLKILYDNIVKYDCDISCCDYFITKLDNADYSNSVVNNEVLIMNNVDAILKMNNSDISTALTTAWGKLYKRSLFYNIVYPIGRLHEDEFTTYKVYDLSKKIIFNNSKLYGYYMRVNSIMKSSNYKKRIDIFYALLERTKYFSNNIDLYLSSFKRCEEYAIGLLTHFDKKFKFQRSDAIKIFIKEFDKNKDNYIRRRIFLFKYFKVILFVSYYIKRLIMRIIKEN